MRWEGTLSPFKKERQRLKKIKWIFIIVGLICHRARIKPKTPDSKAEVCFSHATVPVVSEIKKTESGRTAHTGWLA